MLRDFRDWLAADLLMASCALRERGLMRGALLLLSLNAALAPGRPSRPAP